MPVRIPKARSSEVFTFGVAGVAGLAPLYMMMPGATERIASQTARWAPRWYVKIGFVYFLVLCSSMQIIRPVVAGASVFSDTTPPPLGGPGFSPHNPNTPHLSSCNPVTTSKLDLLSCIPIKKHTRRHTVHSGMLTPKFQGAKHQLLREPRRAGNPVHHAPRRARRQAHRQQATPRQDGQGRRQEDPQGHRPRQHQPGPLAQDAVETAGQSITHTHTHTNG